MTVYAQLILQAIGTGYRLRVPFDHDNSPATLVDAGSDNSEAPKLSKYHIVRPAIGPLEAEAVKELLVSNNLWRITENQHGQRYGWRDIGLDGTKADFYCMIQ